MDRQPRIGAYARLSVDRDGDAASPDRQLADIDKLAEARGWVVAGRYVDRNLSGYTGERRPEFERLLADIGAGRIDGVAAWKLDRLSRNRGDWHRLAELVDKGALLAAVHDPVDTSSPLGLVVVDLLASMARAESANTSTRILRAMEDRAEAGKPHAAGGRVFGYTKGFEIVPDEAAAIRWAAEQAVAGASMRSLARRLNERGLRTARGNEWVGHQLARTLVAPTLAGIRVHKGREIVGTWPAIIDRTTHEQLKAMAQQRKDRARPGGPRKYLLSSLARCGLCGAPLNGHTNPKGVRRYRCVRNLGGCGRVGILGEALDEFVRDAVLDALDGPGLGAMLRRQADRADTAAVVAELQAAEGRLDQLAADHYGSGVLTRAEFMAARTAVTGRIAELRAELSSGTDAAILADLVGTDLSGWWNDPDRDNDQRRALLDVVLEAVEVGPMRRGGAGWDPDRVADGLRWRV